MASARAGFRFCYLGRKIINTGRPESNSSNLLLVPPVTVLHLRYGYINLVRFSRRQGSLMHSTPTNRRTFLRSMIAAGLASSGVAGLEVKAESVANARVVYAEDPHLRSVDRSDLIDTNRMLSLLDQAMQHLFQTVDPVQSWARIVRPGQRVALKVNALGGRGLSTHPALVEAVCARLQTAGVAPQQIVVFDRDTQELVHAGFRIATGGGGVECYGTDRVGFTEDLFRYGSVGSRLSRILTERCDVLINLPVLKDHDVAGVSLALKNMYGVIHNPNKYHPNGCDPYIADLNMLPELRARLRLHLCDATTACYEGGPAFKPEFTWRPNALIVSQDPVALDTVGWQAIERKRAEKGLKTLEVEQRPPSYLVTASDADHRLGMHDLRHIDLVHTSAQS